MLMMNLFDLIAFTMFYLVFFFGNLNYSWMDQEPSRQELVIDGSEGAKT